MTDDGIADFREGWPAALLDLHRRSGRNWQVILVWLLAVDLLMMTLWWL